MQDTDFYEELISYFEKYFEPDGRHCDKCGCRETYDNIVIAYDIRGKMSFLCESCVIEEFENEYYPS